MVGGGWEKNPRINKHSTPCIKHQRVLSWILHKVFLFSFYLTFLRKLGLYAKLCQHYLFFIYSHIYYIVLIETI